MPSESLIRAALHYASTTTPFYECYGDSNGAPKQGTGDSKYQATLDLRNADLITQVNWNNAVEYQATPGLRVYIEELKKVQLPTQRWQPGGIR